MIDEHFFSNIGFVTDSLEATKTIVDSIEDDVRSVKTLIQERLQRRMDLEQLVSLLQTENDILKSKLSLMKLENKDLQNSSFGDRLAIEEEYEDKILVAQAEMDRVLQENRAVKEERDSILSKAQELDLYCTQIENQLESLKKEHESIIQQAQDAELERSQFEQAATQLVRERQQQNEEFRILQENYQEAVKKIHQLETWRQSVVLRKETPEKSPPKVIQRLDSRVQDAVSYSPDISERVPSLDDYHFSDHSNPYQDKAALSSSAAHHFFPSFDGSIPVSEAASPQVPYVVSLPSNYVDPSGSTSRLPHIQLETQNIEPKIEDSTAHLSMSSYDLRDPEEYYDTDGVQLDDLLRFKV